MGIFKFLLALAIPAAGVTATVIYYREKQARDRVVFYGMLDKKAGEIEKKGNSYELKALRTGDKDEKWELMYWDKVWEDGKDRKNTEDYKTQEKDKWESKFWERYRTGIMEVKNVGKDEIDGIYRNKKYPSNGEKYREMCFRGYLKGEKYIKSPNSGHVCLYSDDVWPKAVEEEIKKTPKKDIGETLWEHKKKISKSSQ